MIFFFDQEIYIILIRSIELYCYNHNVKIKETKTEVEKWRCIIDWCAIHHSDNLFLSMTIVLQ